MKSLEIIISVAVAFSLGYVWYRVLFKRHWAQRSDNNNHLGNRIIEYILIFLSMCVVAYFMDNGCLETHINEGGLGHGLYHGGLYAVSYAVPIIAIHHVYQKKKLTQFLIDAGYAILFFTAIGGMLSLLTFMDYNTTEEPKIEDAQVVAVNDTIPKVTGIGGIFFFADDVEKTKEWYEKNLGVVSSEYGSSFEFRNVNRPDEINYLQWSPFKTGNSYFQPSKKEFMINYRVQNMDELVRNLKKNGVNVVDDIETVEYGKFVHIVDDDGNKIELWEPIDSVLTELGGETTK